MTDHVMVPREPTEAMLQAGKAAHMLTHPIADISVAIWNAYTAMLSAAPAVSTGVTVPAGMVAWGGGDSAPEDWDGGPVLRRDGTWDDQMGAKHRGPHWWEHDDEADDVVAYCSALNLNPRAHLLTTRRAADPAPSTEAEVERLRTAIADVLLYHGRLPDETVARLRAALRPSTTEGEPSA